uniref:Soluble Rieske-type ferredoxin domain-containing protein n=1 Tax=Sinocyclocheilus anshuiensis TaxID=1608454 RepID=A0A671MHS5_9TELE
DNTTLCRLEQTSTIQDARFTRYTANRSRTRCSLELGDIEEINNKLCIVCPKHKYKITLAEGEGLYKATNPTEKVPIPQWYSKGMKQRVHKVTEVDEDIFVTLSNCPGWVESDYYQTEKGRAELRKAQESEVGEEDVNADEDV